MLSRSFCYHPKMGIRIMIFRSIVHRFVNSTIHHCVGWIWCSVIASVWKFYLKKDSYTLTHSLTRSPINTKFQHCICITSLSNVWHYKQCVLSLRKHLFLAVVSRIFVLFCFVCIAITKTRATTTAAEWLIDYYITAVTKTNKFSSFPWCIWRDMYGHLVCMCV